MWAQSSLLVCGGSGNLGVNVPVQMRLPERFCATRVRLLLVKRTHISHPISRYKEGNASNKGLRNEGGGGVSYASGVKSISDISVMHLILSGVGLEGDIHHINGRCGGGCGIVCFLVLKV